MLRARPRTPVGWSPATDDAALCREHPELDWVPDLIDEDAYVVVSSAIKDVCDVRCTIRDQCLKWAMDSDAYGFWAGTSRYQRNQLGRSTPRVKCPGCSSVNVAPLPRGEVCLSCGLSWNV